MSVLDRAALQESPLADLHALASELSIDGYRRLRKPQLIDAILARQGGDPETSETPAEPGDAETNGAEAAEPAEAPSGESAEQEPPGARRRRSRRGSRSRTGGARDEEPSGAAQEEEGEAPAQATARAKASARAKAPARATGPARAAAPARAPAPARGKAKPQEEPPPAHEEDELVEGVVELLPNGSGFVRVDPPEPSDDDVYVSAAQVKRCELVSGDRIAGPRRAPRRSERFASLVRVDTINGSAASELASGGRFDDLPAAFPDERFRLGSEDPTIKAIEFLTPVGKGSRVTITGAARAGKSEALRRLALALAAREELQLSIALAGVRPEEISDWRAAGFAPAAEVSFAASADAQDHAVELVVDQARRVAARGAHAVVLIDTLDGLHPQAARKAMAAARKIVDGGSLTVIATAVAALGGETTVIALDVSLASTGRFPALDLTASGTLRPERLVGEAGAEAIARARIEALDD